MNFIEVKRKFRFELTGRSTSTCRAFRIVRCDQAQFLAHVPQRFDRRVATTLRALRDAPTKRLVPSVRAEKQVSVY